MLALKIAVEHIPMSQVRIPRVALDSLALETCSIQFMHDPQARIMSSKTSMTA